MSDRGASGTRRRWGPRAGQSGFSLIELMLAMCVFEVGALGLLALLFTSAQGVTSGRNLTHGTTLAASKLDELMRLPYDDASLTVGVHDDGTLNLDSAGNVVTGSALGTADGNYERKWTIETPVGGLNFKSVTVTVRWWDANRKRWAAVTVRGGRSEQ